MPARLIFYFGLRSPYAWLAQRLLSRHLGADAVSQIDWVPYWEPRADTLSALRSQGGDILYRSMSRERHLYILGDLKRTASRLGCTLRWPVDGPNPQWEPAHRACLAARPAQAATLRTVLFAARWEHGLDITDPSVIKGLCRGLGLTEVTEALDSPATDAAALSALSQAHRHGVFGLPFFVLGRERWWGVDRLPFALQAAGLPWRALAADWAGLPQHEGVCS